MVLRGAGAARRPGVQAAREWQMGCRVWVKSYLQCRLHGQHHHHQLNGVVVQDGLQRVLSGSCMALRKEPGRGGGGGGGGGG